MKDELGGTHIKEFVGLRAKMYSVLSADEKEMKKVKEAKKFVVNWDSPALGLKGMLV